MATICRDAVQQWNGRVLILAHVKELLEQAADKLHAMAPDLWNRIGVYSAGLKSRDTEHPIIVAGIQSIFRRAAELDRFDLILIDEAHMLPPDGEGMYRTFMAEARLVMVGDGELLECCKTLAQVWGLTDRVTFTGAIPHAEILPLFAQACCFVQHSVRPSYGDAEGTPVVILEAQAAGLPVIATRHAGITEAVVHDKTGFLIDELDVDGMSNHMLHLVRNPSSCTSMGNNARAQIRANFSMQRHIACLQAVIDDARSSR